MSKLSDSENENNFLHDKIQDMKFAVHNFFRFRIYVRYYICFASHSSIF